MKPERSSWSEERGLPACSFRLPAENFLAACCGTVWYGWLCRKPVGGTPTDANGTVALPSFNCIVPVKSKMTIENATKS